MRIAFAAAAWTTISNAEGTDVARAWFVEGNPVLGGDTPVVALREDRVTEILAAVEAFLAAAGQEDAHRRVLRALVRAIRDMNAARPHRAAPSKRDVPEEAEAQTGADSSMAEEDPHASEADPAEDLGRTKPGPAIFEVFEVVVTREGERWLAAVPALPGSATWASSMTELRGAVRETIVVATGLPDDAEPAVRFRFVSDEVQPGDEWTWTDIHDIARELLGGVGGAVMQAMSGVKDRAAPARWAQLDGPEPGAEAQARLRLGHHVWRTLEQSEGPSVALAWLVGSNPRLGHETPLIYIRELRAQEVLGAAEAFVNDIFE
jgi:hypothetical protein